MNRCEKMCVTVDVSKCEFTFEFAWKASLHNNVEGRRFFDERVGLDYSAFVLIHDMVT